MRISDDVQRVLDSTDLVRLIGEYVRLKPAGREYKGLCPFHDDHKPSMCVVPHKGIFHCFSCGTGGDAIRFVQLHLHLEFREALEFLAQRAGIDLKPRRAAGEQAADGSATTRVTSNEIIAAHELARDFYRNALKHEQHGALARKLFADRRISPEMIQRFELGVTPGDSGTWDALVRHLATRRAKAAHFETVGLITRRKDGSGFVDRFRGRLIFPIHDEMGRPIAFGARRIDPEDEPKYLNSPEHPRFHKSRTLYALHLARQAIRDQRRAVVVEGYTDVIACHQAGLTNVVATLGTALTADHTRLLRHICDRVVLVFDGDEAGRKAADRAIEIFFDSQLDVAIALLEQGCDPAELLDKPDGVERMNRCIDGAVEVVEYLLDVCRNQWSQAARMGVSAKQRALSEFLDRIGSLGFHRMSPLRRDLVIARLTQLTGLDRAALLASIPRAPRRNAPTSKPDTVIEVGRQPGLVESDVPQARIEAERRVVACLINTPDLVLEHSEDGTLCRDLLRPDQFVDAVARALLTDLLASIDDESSSPDNISSTVLRGPNANDIAAWLWQLSRDTADQAQAIASQFHEHLKALCEYLAIESYHQSWNDGTDAIHGEDPKLKMDQFKNRINHLRAIGGNRRQYSASRSLRAPVVKTGDNPAATTEQ